MLIEELKKQIDNKLNINFPIIFIAEDDFIPVQYYREIADYSELSIIKLESLEGLPRNDIFSNWDDNALFIYKVDTLEEKMCVEDNVIVICKKVDKAVYDMNSNFIVEVPKLEKWQIKDYAYSNLSGIEESKLDWLLDSCQYNIHRLDVEVEKLCIFNEKERAIRFNEFVEDGIFDDLSNKTVFDLTNAIFRKDINSAKYALHKKDAMDISEMGFYTLLYNGFRNIMLVQLSAGATPENTGINKGQFYAIKKNNIGYYTREELIKIFIFLVDVDKQIKTGELPVDNLIDYLTVKILGGAI